MDDLPEIGAAVAPVFEQLPPERRPLLVALAERIAASRYREWARADAAHGAELLACATREEEIARRVEALYPDAARVQREIAAAHPGLEETYRALFAGRPLAQQFTIQARGEHLGAATWRALAAQATDPTARDVFLACAPLEEESAAVLERLIG
jgi:hypothetical protein